MHGLRAAVLRGGPSEEYDISMKSGEGVLAALSRNNVNTHDIVINRRGEWIKQGFEKQPHEALSAVDVVFIALHGSYGEDGTVQRILERLNVPYTGSKPYPSSVAMNKILAKDQLRQSGIKMPAHFRVTSEGTDIRRIAHAIESLFGPEYIVKPVSGGSSIGTMVAYGAGELVRVLQHALKERSDVLVEQRILGREATVGVVERFRDEAYYRLPAIEIVPPPEAGFFDLDAKYSGKTDEICPGRFSRSEKEELEGAAYRVHQLLGLSQYSRSDFIVADDGIYFLEVNTLPGLTTESLFPKALSAVGCDYDNFILHLLNDALVDKR